MKYKNKHKLPLLLILFLSYCSISSYSENKSLDGITFVNNVIPSSIIHQVSDSISIEERFHNLEKKFQANRPYALEEALALHEYMKQINYEGIVKLSTAKMIGIIYGETSENDKAIFFYKKALEAIKTIQNNNLENVLDRQKNLNFDFLSGEIYYKISAIYIEKFRNLLQDKNASKNQANKKLLQKLKDSAQIYGEKLNELPSINKKIQKIKAISFKNLSGLFFLDSLYTKAEKYAQKAVEINKKLNDNKGIASSLNNLGNVYLAQNDFKKAKTIYSKAIKFIDLDNSFKAIQFKISLYENLAWSMRNLEEFEAYDNLETSYTLGDSIRLREWKREIKRAEMRSNETIAKLENEKEVAIEKAKLEKENTDKMLAGLSLLILIVSGVIIYNYKLRQRNLQLKLSESKLLERQKINRLKSDAQVKILNATIDGKETERKQIAETLHDSVSALLSSANMHLSATKKQFNGSSPIELEKTQAIILEASNKVRDLSHNLVSSILLKFGLEYALKDIAKKYSNCELTFHTDFNNVQRYSQDFEIKIYNVTHELINNIIKHSKASNAHILMEERNNFLSILIEDDGKGFNYQDNKTKSGLGLNQIEARIQVMNGNFLIESAKKRGTKITISVPTSKKNATNLA